MNDRLYRSRDDRMLAGVAGGLADLWGADPSLVRIIWALLVVFTGGLALVVYIVMALVVPEEDDLYPRHDPAAMPPAAPPAGMDPAADSGQAFAEPVPQTGWTTTAPPPGYDARAARRAARAERRAARRESGGVPGSLIGGIVLILLGSFFLAREWLPQIDFDWFWPLVLVGLGVALLISALGRGRGQGGAA